MSRKDRLEGRGDGGVVFAMNLPEESTVPSASSFLPFFSQVKYLGGVISYRHAVSHSILCNGCPVFSDTQLCPFI